MEDIKKLLTLIAAIQKKGRIDLLGRCSKVIKQLQAENKQQADFLSLAKEEMDSLQAKLKDSQVYGEFHKTASDDTMKIAKQLQDKLEKWQVTKKSYDEHCLVTAKILQENTKRIQQDGDTIQQIQAKLAELKTDGIVRMKKLCTDILNLKHELRKYRWIPVSEGLPENHIPCLVFDGENFHVADRYQYTSTPQKNGWKGSSITWKVEENITHWKPITLPEQALKGLT